MAPFAFLALLLAAANPDLPVGRSTAPPPPPPAAAPTPAPAAPSTTAPAAGGGELSMAPSDDYGYVAFCYGAESGYLSLYDRVMPDVERIERAFPGSTPVDQALAEYPKLRSESQTHLTTYAAALAAAEQASPQALAPRGLQAIRQGRSTWDGAATATLAQTARAWMGWAAAEDCTTRAAALAARSRPSSATSPNAAPGGTRQSAVELDRLANPPGLAASPAPSTPTAPPLALRGSAPAPTVTAIVPRPADGLGVSFAATPATATAPAAAGLGVSFDASPAPLAAAPGAPPAVPPGLPLLEVSPPGAPKADPPPWRGIL